MKPRRSEGATALREALARGWLVDLSWYRGVASLEQAKASAELARTSAAEARAAARLAWASFNRTRP